MTPIPVETIEAVKPSDEACKEALGWVEFRPWGYWTDMADGVTKERVNQTIRHFLSTPAAPEVESLMAAVLSMDRWIRGNRDDQSPMDKHAATIAACRARSGEGA